MSDMSLGMKLQRMGAGFAGNLAQFDSARQQEELTRMKRDEMNRALSKERLVAMARDAQTAEKFLDMGEVGKTLELLDNRIEFINQYGGDASDTQEMRDLIASGDIETAKKELNLFTTQAQINGLIEPLVSTKDQIELDKLDLDRAEFVAKYGTTPEQAGGAVSAPGAMGGTEGAAAARAQKELEIKQAEEARKQAQFEAEQKDIPAQWQQPYMESSAAEVKATREAAELSQLAAEFEAMKELPSGFKATFDEAAKKFFGEEDAVTAVRQRFSGGVNSEVMQQLPPGASSDKDIEIAREGFPTGNPSKELITSFLRGQVKARALDAAYQRFKVQYIDENRTLRGVNQAWRENAPAIFEGIKKEIARPINRAYTIDDYAAEAASRGLIK